MRLIDADAMNEKLFYKQLGGKDTLITAECAFNMIKAQPTAYDISKVVAELKEVSNKYCSPRHLDCEGCGYYALEEAIEIVRKGGVE